MILRNRSCRFGRVFGVERDRDDSTRVIFIDNFESVSEVTLLAQGGRNNESRTYSLLPRASLKYSTATSCLP